MLIFISAISAGLAIMSYFFNKKDPIAVEDNEMYHFMCNTYLCLLPLLWTSLPIYLGVCILFMYSLSAGMCVYYFIKDLVIGQSTISSWIFIGLTILGFAFHATVLIGRFII